MSHRSPARDSQTSGSTSPERSKFPAIVAVRGRARVELSRHRRFVVVQIEAVQLRMLFLRFFESAGADAACYRRAWAPSTPSSDGPDRTLIFPPPRRSIPSTGFDNAPTVHQVHRPHRQRQQHRDAAERIHIQQQHHRQHRLATISIRQKLLISGSTRTRVSRPTAVMMFGAGGDLQIHVAARRKFPCPIRSTRCRGGSASRRARTSSVIFSSSTNRLVIACSNI